MRMRARRKNLLPTCFAAGVVSATLVVGVASSAPRPTVVQSALRGAPPCDLVAAPARSATRVPATAMRSVNRMVARLRPGQIGCLLPGVYDEDVTIRTSGTSKKPITLTSARGSMATLRGTLYVPRGSHDITIARLRLDGSTTGGSPSPQINGTDVALRRNVITNANTAICLIIGGDFERYGSALDVIVDRNRIHHCGRLPATGHDHGIYVEGSDHARITNNVIFKNADWGIQLYPDADNTVIADNVIVDNGGGGIIIASESGGSEYSADHASDYNLVTRNVLADSPNGHGLEAWWGGELGNGNVAVHNCLWGNRNGNLGSLEAVKTANNITAAPAFTDPAHEGYALAATSKCRRVTNGSRP